MIQKRVVIIILLIVAYNHIYAQDTIICNNYSIQITKHTTTLNSQISLLNTIYFNPDDYQLRPKYNKNLIEIINVLDKYPNCKIEIIGHANIQNTNPYSPHFQYVYQLSFYRALSVKTFFVENGINANRIYLRAYGGAQVRYPFAVNEFYKKYNRRVEIRIIEN